MTTNFLVLDASLTFRAITANEKQPILQQQIAQWQQDGYQLIAPTLWYYETVSSLCKMVRFGQYTEEEADQAIELANKLPIHCISPDEAQMQIAIEWTYRLKRAAAYDSFYLALAETYGCNFWTADSKLFNAAQQPWIKLWV